MKYTANVYTRSEISPDKEQVKISEIFTQLVPDSCDNIEIRRTVIDCLEQREAYRVYNIYYKGEFKFQIIYDAADVKWSVDSWVGFREELELSILEALLKNIF